MLFQTFSYHTSVAIIVLSGQCMFHYTWWLFKYIDQTNRVNIFFKNGFKCFQCFGEENEIKLESSRFFLWLYLFYRKHERNTSVWLKEGLSNLIYTPWSILTWIPISVTNLCHLWRNHHRRSKLQNLSSQVLLLRRWVYLKATGNNG